MSVETAFAEACGFRNFFHLRFFIADSGEDLLGGAQEQFSGHGCSLLGLAWFRYSHASQNSINRLLGIFMLYKPTDRYILYT